MAERSFAREVEDLKIGAGQEFRGEGILAVTKALLESGVGYVAGYQGAPISHLMDVLADAEDILGELGVHFEASASEAAAAATLAASRALSDPRRGHLEGHGRHQCRLRRARQSRLGRGDGRRADHRRRGLRRRLLDHAGAEPRLRDESRRSGCSIRGPTSSPSSRRWTTASSCRRRRIRRSCSRSASAPVTSTAASSPRDNKRPAFHASRMRWMQPARDTSRIVLPPASYAARAGEDQSPLAGGDRLHPRARSSTRVFAAYRTQGRHRHAGRHV